MLEQRFGEAEAWAKQEYGVPFRWPYVKSSYKEYIKMDNYAVNLTFEKLCGKHDFINIDQIMALKKEEFHSLYISIRSYVFISPIELDTLFHKILPLHNIQKFYIKIADYEKKNNYLLDFIRSSLSLNEVGVFFNSPCQENEDKFFLEKLQKVIETNLSVKKLGLKSFTSLFHANLLTPILSLLSHNNISELAFMDIDFSYQNIEKLAQSLRCNNSITNLGLSRCGIEDKDIKSLCAAFRFNETITTLKIDHNLITIDGAKDISKLLEVNSTITSLDIGNNNIGGEGVNYIFRALRVNSTLTDLNLRSNCNENSPLNSPLYFLMSNTTLTSLDLSECDMPFRLVLSLFNGLSCTNPNLTIKLTCVNLVDIGGAILKGFKLLQKISTRNFEGATIDLLM